MRRFFGRRRTEVTPLAAEPADEGPYAQALAAYRIVFSAPGRLPAVWEAALMERAGEQQAAVYVQCRRYLGGAPSAQTAPGDSECRRIGNETAELHVAMSRRMRALSVVRGAIDDPRAYECQFMEAVRFACAAYVMLYEGGRVR